MVTMRNFNVTIWSYFSIFTNSDTSWDVDSCETSDVRVWFAELGWLHCLLGLLKAATEWVLFLNWRRSKCLGSGKTGGQKHIRKLRIHFASMRRNCINPAPTFPLYDLSHWLDLIAEQNIKGSEEDESIKLCLLPEVQDQHHWRLDLTFQNTGRSLHQLQCIWGQIFLEYRR